MTIEPMPSLAPKSTEIDLASLYLLLGQMNGKLDAVVIQNDRQASEIRDLSLRVQHLERAKTWLLGAAAGLSVVATYLTKQFFGQP